MCAPRAARNGPLPAEGGPQSAIRAVRGSWGPPARSYGAAVDAEAPRSLAAIGALRALPGERTHDSLPRASSAAHHDSHPGQRKARAPGGQKHGAPARWLVCRDGRRERGLLLTIHATKRDNPSGHALSLGMHDLPERHDELSVLKSARAMGHFLGTRPPEHGNPRLRVWQRWVHAPSFRSGPSPQIVRIVPHDLHIGNEAERAVYALAARPERGRRSIVSTAEALLDRPQDADRDLGGVEVLGDQPLDHGGQLPGSRRTGAHPRPHPFRGPERRGRRLPGRPGRRPGRGTAPQRPRRPSARPTLAARRAVRRANLGRS